MNLTTSEKPSPSEKVMPERIHREPEVIKITGLSRSTIWRLESKGKFPRRRRLSPRAVGWLESEILAWIATRQEGPNPIPVPKRRRQKQMRPKKASSSLVPLENKDSEQGVLGSDRIDPETR